MEDWSIYPRETGNQIAETNIGYASATSAIINKYIDARKFAVGDFNQDGKVDLQDLSAFLGHFNSTQQIDLAIYDIAKSKSVSGQDLSMMLGKIK